MLRNPPLLIEMANPSHKHPESENQCMTIEVYAALSSDFLTSVRARPEDTTQKLLQDIGAATGREDRA